ncbi:MAG TPA: hypothetical protein ENG51_19330 [Deltaproteobacteria bacterium]|nr:hypothetical protein [Deltaproteobacteria bacterium]
MKLAILWNESFLWGLITFWSCKSAGIPFDLVNSDQIKRDILDNYQILLVPGGWAAQKGKSLGDTGKQKVREFIRSGGSFLGFCGGAGLALDVPYGLSLLPLKRKGARDRLVNFSGGVLLNPVDTSHALWEKLSYPYEFYVWWPSQFDLENNHRVKIIAHYKNSGTDFRVSDLAVDDIKLWGKKWKEWEEIYKIKLNPEILWGEPAIVEGNFGNGKVVLSYVHLDTPRHKNSQVALRNLCEYLSLSSHESEELSEENRDFDLSGKFIKIDTETVDASNQIGKLISKFYNFGYRNLVWNWRNPWLLQWKRGLRGLEYTTLIVMTKELTERIRNSLNQEQRLSPTSWKEKLLEFKRMLEDFLEEASVLLGKERFLLEKSCGPLSKLTSHDYEVDKLRKKLFGEKMSFGGKYRELIQLLDELLFAMLKATDSLQNNK